MNEQDAVRSELDLIDMIDMIWEGRLMVAVVTLLFLAIGAAVYALAPERFQSEVEITPLTGAEFADYADLQDAGSFYYTRNTLAVEFTRYLTDRDRLARAEEESGVSNLKVDFRIEDETVTRGDEQVRELLRLRMNATGYDRDRLEAFVADALKRAGRDLALGMRAEIERRLAAAEEGRFWAIRRAEVSISAEREKLAAERRDTIEKLKKDALVARAFGLDRPIELQAQTLAIDRFAPAAARPPQENQPQLPEARYFDGYLALEEEISLLENRESDDPFIPRLRELEKDIYLLKNNTQKAQLTALLERSVLSRPDQARFVSYSLIEAKARKTFPTPLATGALALALGLLAGIVFAVVRGVRASRQRRAPASAG